jgi:uncharacterized membrane protein
MGRAICRWLLAALFLVAGVAHLASPRLFLPVMPPWVPAKLPCILASGGAELAGAVGLLLPGQRIRRAAGWGLVALLVAVFPANLYMAMAHVRIHGFPRHEWMAWARLPLQAVFIAMVVAGCGLDRAREGKP